jgi:large subunit ribosomal protein L11
MNYISKKQEGKKETVKNKAILVRLKLIIGAGGASMTPPLGPILGQYGINIMEFCNEFNNETKEIFEAGIALRVILWINVMKAFYFEIQMPKISIILKEYYKKEFEEAKGGKVYIEKERLLKDCFKLAILSNSFNRGEKKWETMEECYLKMKVLEILGTCRSCKIYIKE